MLGDELEVRRALESAEVTGANVERLRKALRVVLFFYSPSPWDEAKRRRWHELSGHEDASSKNLCDVVRAALAD